MPLPRSPTMCRPWRTWARLRRALTCIAATGLATAGLAGCSSSAPPDAAPAQTQVLVALPLQTDAKGLAARADDVADPSSSQFDRFLTTAQVAGTFGARSETITADEKTLAADGMHLQADPTHGALWGTVTAAQVGQYFGTTLVDDDGTIEPDSNPRIPGGLVGVTGVVGLVASQPTTTATTPGTASPSCPTSIPTQASLAGLFGLSQILALGATGHGADIDVVAVHTFEPAVFENYNRCAGAHLDAGRVSQTTVPDTPATVGGPEVALDSLALTLLAPDTRLHIIRFDPSTSLVFPLMNMLGDGAAPNVLDLTFTYCETQLQPAELSLAEWLLSAFAASGTTSVAAAGDTGSSGCYPTTDNPAVTYPASSQFVTAIGGASYSGSPSAATGLSVWNTSEIAGGGGGVSSKVMAPPWQHHTMRQLPDLSAFAEPGVAGNIPVCTTDDACQWQPVGGTSLGTAVLGATGALLAQHYQTKGGSARWGNLAERLWRSGAHDEAVVDITAGANTTFSSACCRAKAGYDTASGWGLLVPDDLADLVAPVTGG